MLLSAVSLAGCGGGGGGNDDGKSTGSVGLTLTSNHISFEEFGSNDIASNPPTIAATISNGTQTYYGTVKTDNLAIDAPFELSGTTSANIKPILSPGSLTTPTGSGQLTVEVCTDNVCGDVVTSQIITYTYAIYSLGGVNTVNLTATAGGSVQTTSVPITPTPPASIAFTAVNSSSSAWLSVAVVNGVVQISANPSSLATGNYNGNVEISGLGGSIEIFVSLTVR